jgi:hypothetical protein
LSIIILGKSVSQERQAKKRGILYGVGTEVTTVWAVWVESQVCAWKGDREKKRELRVGVAIGGWSPKRNWSIIGANWSWRNEEPGFQVGRVNSCVSFTETASVVVGLLIGFLAVSLEFPVERFLVTCAINTLINEWHIHWVIHDKWMVNPSGYPW